MHGLEAKRMSSLRLLLCFLLKQSIGLVCIAQQHPLLAVSSPFDWSTIQPLNTLVWQECYPNSQSQRNKSGNKRQVLCARLRLPLDYHNSSNPAHVILPILNIAPIDQSETISTRKFIVISPGGAGNSRIQTLLAILSTNLLDTIDVEGKYNFITFDQRGFGYAEPTAKCFGSVFNGLQWAERMKDLGKTFSSTMSDGNFGFHVDGASVLGTLCARADYDTDIRRHMTTAYAARDMLEILNKLHTSSDSGIPHPKLDFIGFSYGTMLGLTFASLYPDRVARMVLDGVVDSDDWVGKWQVQHVQDSDEIWKSFFSDCFISQEACPFWRPSDTSPADQEKRFASVLERLSERPAYLTQNEKIRVVTRKDVEYAIVQALLAPFYSFTALAEYIDSLLQGISNITLGFPFDPDLGSLSRAIAEDVDYLASSNLDAGTSLNCGDAASLANSTVKEFKRYLSVLEKLSNISASWQGERKARCLGWPATLTPKWRFTGPFASNMTPPLMFLSNTLDPMTPLHNAKKMSSLYQGSIMIEQKARGHCSLLNTIPSKCILDHLSRYLLDGLLPVDGNVCDAECNVFDGSCIGNMQKNGTRHISHNLI
ncbi:peptidase tripeptidyl-peptidase protein [Phlyctema vagabunda]|uniref:Peptidase tripeptidyl-peptidase protein n=1 Tax=Phlyctema vagabunda TaxID=108571 RepID=A0ABR4PEP0_9HELO